MISKSSLYCAGVLMSAIAAGLAGAAVRYGFIEWKAVHNACVAAVASWPCDIRSVVIVTLMNTPALGVLALVLGLLALFGNRRWPVVAAVITGALGLILYNVELGACGLLLGALRAVRDWSPSALDAPTPTPGLGGRTGR